MKFVSSLRHCIVGAVAVCAAQVFAQSTVFSDDFNRASLNGGSYTYTTTVSAGDGSASITSNTLVLTNDSSVTANAAGRVSLAVATSSFSAPFSSTLNSNSGTVTWSFNMQQPRSDPSGFSASSYGVAFVLGGTNSDFTQGNGYAVVVGQSGTTDPVRLVKYTGGLQSSTNIITATSVATDIGTDYLSLSVTYTASTNTWSLSGRNDGSSAFTSPTTGTLSSLGSSAVDSTYTSVALTSMGALWNYSTAATQNAQFDNFSVSVSAVPEPSTYAALAGIAALGGVMLHRRRQRLAAKA